MKITVVGAGAVGATCVDNIARKELAEELIMPDIRKGCKAINMMQTSALLWSTRRSRGNQLLRCHCSPCNQSIHR